MDDRSLSGGEIVDCLVVSCNTVHSWISSRALPGQRIWLVWKSEQEKVDLWVQAGQAVDLQRVEA